MPSVPALPPSGPFALAEPWLAPWRLAVRLTWGSMASLAQLYDGKPLRAFWSTNLSQAADRCLRSPEFLELMAGNLKTMAALTRFNSQLHIR